MNTKVFLSVGRTYTPAQEEFVSELESFLNKNGLTAQTVGRTYFSSEQPLRAIMHVLRECCGALILAFERIYIKQGCEKRGSPKESQLQETNLPTVWNQIEAAMAYTLDYPLMMIVDETLRTEGLLENGYDWYVMRIPLTKEALAGREFVGVFNDWRNRVLELAEQRAGSGGGAAAAPETGATRSAGINLGMGGGQQPEPQPQPDQQAQQQAQQQVQQQVQQQATDALPAPDLLSNEVRRGLFNALLDAYPDRESLRICVGLGLDKELDEIAGGKTMPETIFNLVSWARKTDHVEQLMHTAYQNNPTNPRLKNFVLMTLGQLPAA